ncbi:MAG: hypothetical protein U9Q74_15195 [Gemmatimonadota bacterium]|nr:hypothetical protein [Gemmatimonadota bacterium]
MTTEPMTCAEYEAHLQDWLEHDADASTRHRMDAHRARCAACAALTREIQDVTAAAKDLPDLTPSRDLWAGIEGRIEAEVVPFPTPVDGVPAAQPAGPGAVPPAAVPAIVESPAAFVAPVSPLTGPAFRRQAPAAWKALLAASVLVAATAAITWTVAHRGATTAGAVAAGTAGADSGFVAAMDLTRNARLASGKTLDQTYDQEISALRTIVNDRRSELDSATVAVLEKNLAIIDKAIAESKAALAQNPSSAFLLDRLTDAYQSKLRVLRAVAAIPVRG